MGGSETYSRGDPRKPGGSLRKPDDSLVECHPFAQLLGVLWALMEILGVWIN